MNELLLFPSQNWATVPTRSARFCPWPRLIHGRYQSELRRSSQAPPCFSTRRPEKDPVSTATRAVPEAPAVSEPLVTLDFPRVPANGLDLHLQPSGSSLWKEAPVARSGCYKILPSPACIETKPGSSHGQSACPSSAAGEAEPRGKEAAAHPSTLFPGGNYMLEHPESITHALPNLNSYFLESGFN